MVNLKVLASGSKGNCYTLDDGKEKLLIECGINWKEIQRNLDFQTSNITACLCSHSHKDHSKSIKDVMKAGIDVFTSRGTIDDLMLTGHRIHPIRAKEQCRVGSWSILPFETEHDCNEPFGFLIVHNPSKTKILFATDTYFVRYKFSGLHAILVECNYCREILEENIEAGRIPESLKNRLLESHFSLDNVKGFLEANDLSQVRKIALIHLSDSNSSASRMISEIRDLTKIETVVAEANMEISLDLFPF